MFFLFIPGVGDDFDNLPDQSEENQKSLGKAYRYD